jgi:hypothetical protein
MVFMGDLPQKDDWVIARSRNHQCLQQSLSLHILLIKILARVGTLMVGTRQVG